MSGEIILIIFQVFILIMSVVVHEVSHGLMAFKLGDSTAKYADRLSLNPIKHFDLWGSLIVPFFMIISFGFGFGWAKPVPYNPYNLKDQKMGPAWVALAGPASNILVAIIFGLGARFIALNYMIKLEIIKNLFNFSGLSPLLSGSFPAIFFWLFMMIMAINIFLAVFNLIPIPPLDGSKLLFAVVPMSDKSKLIFEQFGFVFLLIIIFFLSAPVSYLLGGVLSLFFRYIVGIGI
ncbi:MAG: site-2 protease family protein [Parcubacteria group bacterium]|jgi:Zn-dependent protease